MQYVFVVRFDDKDRPAGRVLGVFSDDALARDYMTSFSGSISADDLLWMERWPVNDLLYTEEDYTWPPKNEPSDG